jgi:hypothetical protein
MELLEHVFNYNNKKNGRNITFSSDNKIFIHMLQYIYFSLLKYEDIKNTKIYYAITHIIYNFKTKSLEFKCKGDDCEIYEKHILNKIIEELMIKYITKDISESNEYTTFLRDNNIITN